MQSSATNAIREANRLGQSIWIDSISREMINSGELRRLVDAGVTGVTSNPSIFEQAISKGSSYDEALVEFAKAERDPQRVFEMLAVEDIRDAADILRPAYDRTQGQDGFVSIEVSPKLAKDTDGTVEEGRRLFKSINRPNVMVKVPGTPEGMPAIRQLTSEGVNVNVTLLFSIAAYRQAAQAYIDGLRDRIKSGRGSPEKIASVASFFISRVDTSADKLLEKPPREVPGIDPEELKGRTGIANAKLAYAEFQKIFHGPEFRDMQKIRAKVQRPLWGSTSTKNPKYRDTMYVEELIGPDTVNTVPLPTLTAFLEHGNATDTVTRDVEAAREQVRQLEALGISLDKITDELLVAGVKAFADSYDKLIKHLEDKLAKISPGTMTSAYGRHKATVDAAVAGAVRGQLAEKIWRKDSSIWPQATQAKSESARDRLGWLDLPEGMQDRARHADSFAAEVRNEGINRFVLLGMGGSAMAAATLETAHTGRSAGDRVPANGFAVLDSTVWSEDGDARVPANVYDTLFLAASKSGTTAETLALERHFRARFRDGQAAARRFAAITDPGTPMAARTSDFRRVFHAPADVGGRFSALSEFGLVPAALAGMDLQKMTESANRMATACRNTGPENPGLQLGAAIAAIAKAGRDKVTILTSPSLEKFGTWAEQILAESLGKAGNGIVPVAQEPAHPAARYGDDRVFIYVGLKDDRTGEVAAELLDSLSSAGVPVSRIYLERPEDLAGEFFRWEFATAVAAHLLGIYPFDEPDVASAKERASATLKRGWVGAAPVTDLGSAVEQLLIQARRRDYISVVAYIPESDAFNRAAATLREGLTARTGLPVTFGYGPRYLHSIGQLHKGGPNNVLVLVLVSDNVYSAGAGSSELLRLMKAQASGDVEALRERGRGCAYVRLHEPAKEIETLVRLWQV